MDSELHGNEDNAANILCLAVSNESESLVHRHRVAGRVDRELARSSRCDASSVCHSPQLPGKALALKLVIDKQMVKVLVVASRHDSGDGPARLCHKVPKPRVDEAADGIG
jgi:hypothetical protein